MYKLLIVDDEAITRSGIIKHVPFEKYGITEISQADDGVNALELAKSFCPDIVLSDIKMPRMDGITFANELKKLNPDCVLIFMSAYSDKEYFIKAIKLKAVSYVEKPIDIDELEAAIKNAVDELQRHISRENISNRMDKVLEESRSLFNNQLALLLIKHETPMEEIEEKISLMDMDIPLDGSFVTLLIKIQNGSAMTPKETENIREHVYKVLNEVLGSLEERALWAYRGNNQIVLHLFTPHSERHKLSAERMVSFAEQIYIRESEVNPISIAIGSVVSGIDQIIHSYISAAVVLQKLFFKKGIPVDYYRGEEPAAAYHFESDLTESFTELIEKGMQSQAVEFVSTLTAQIMLCTDTQIITIKNEYYRLLCVVDKYAVGQFTGQTEQSGESDLVWNVVASTESLSELSRYLIGKINRYFSELRDQNNNDAIALKIQKYISFNYHNSALSIEEISDEIGMSPAYLCVLFKAQTGKTINGYITDVRVEKAKELLKDGKVKIGEIAKRCGYNDSDYFAKVFKKMVDCSPSEYRKKYII
ncbi:response regulator [Hydrogenoanaerobacterium sp.]|uniref:response regulator n=1 Tax=Hydrogenoanaerobacterium sp. TaxID=2953763 RepID=UPI00289831D3|nr:response regulator [Hydrogenoanaerobacterium sp.]